MEWLEQECERELALNRKYLDGLHVGHSWQGLKGIGKLRTPEQLHVARALWTERDEIAQQRDVSPTHVMGHSVLRTIAEQLPGTQRELTAIRGFPRRRRGAGKDAIAAIAEAKPRVVVHFGCDPATFARDARYWADYGYAFKHLEVVDAFGLTHHFETIAVLEQL